MGSFLSALAVMDLVVSVVSGKVIQSLSAVVVGKGGWRMVLTGSRTG